MTPQLVFGLLLATLGVMFTLDNLHILRARLPPVLAARVRRGRRRADRPGQDAGARVGGGLWIFVGGDAGQQAGLWGSLWDFWPLVLVVLGAYVWQSLGQSRAADRGDGPVVSALPCWADSTEKCRQTSAVPS